MPKVRILPELIINKIAAGEVVERPASVVKELVENALDSGADRILVTIKNGGKDLISVTDNGSGMCQEDARLALERHATSKVYTEADLERICTLGFRGEALASIASVSKLELTTCDNELEGATRIVIHGGHQESCGGTGFPQGTRVTVENLFYNTPARLKFMKAPTTEFMHIQELLVNQALARPHVQFRLTHNQQIVFNLGIAQSFEHRIFQIFGDELEGGLIQFEHQEHYLKAVGWFSRPTHPKPSKRWQYLFVNDRFVKCPPISHAIYDAYRTLLMKQQHPAFFLRLTLDPSEIDVNVHPAKTEIRFRNSQLVHTILVDRLSKALRDSTREVYFGPREATHETSLLPELPAASGKFKGHQGESLQRQLSIPLSSGLPTGSPSIAKAEEPASPVLFPPTSHSHFPPVNPVPTAPILVVRESPQLPPGIEKTLGPLAPLPAAPDLHFQPVNSQVADLLQFDAKPRPQSHFFLLGQLHHTYILAEAPEGLVLIDQHAAHERILFEKYRQEFYQGQIQSQDFLVPMLLELSPQNGILLEQYLPQFQKMGFRIANFGRSTYTIESLPAILPEAECKSTLLAILDELVLFGKSGRLEEVFNDVIERVACHAAIRAGQTLSREEMQSLLTQLEHLDIHLFCPHGRPVLIEIATRELEKRFKRVL